jgi:acyl-coenzyme A thioesterase PaaI-like protein
MAESPAERLMASWNRLSGTPGGSWVFSRMLSWWVPYTGSIRPHVRELRPGYARVSMDDRRRVRNHLNSIHAIALVNLGEVTSGLALITAPPTGIRSIATALHAEFLKKGRGVLTARCDCRVPPSLVEATETVVVGEITDRAEDIVARITVTWRLSPPAA